MKSLKWIACLAAGFALLGALPTAQATEILVFGQNGTASTVSATVAGGVTTVTNMGSGISVSVTGLENFGGGSFNANLTFSMHNTSANNATSDGTQITQAMTGSFSIVGATGSPFAGVTLLTGTFTDALFGGGTGLTFSASNATAGESVSFTAGAGSPITSLSQPQAISWSFTNVSPTIVVPAAGTTNFTIPAFNSSISGNFSANPATTVIPEPGTIAIALSGVPVLGLLWARRRRQS
jgi:hypothetical protein